MISLMSLLEDDQFSARSPFKDFRPNYFQSLALPVLAIINIFKNMFSKDDSSTDSNSARFAERIDENNFKNKFYISKVFDFKGVKNYAKQNLGISFNEFMIGFISKSCKQWFEHYGVKDSSQVQVFLPFSMKSFPTTYENFSLDNSVA